jgi:hypothetical protein
MSIFPSVNNVRDISVDLSAGTLAGFTEKEIREAYPEHLQHLATDRGLTVDGLLTLCEESTTDVSSAMMEVEH